MNEIHVPGESYRVDLARKEVTFMTVTIHNVSSASEAKAIARDRAADFDWAEEARDAVSEYNVTRMTRIRDGHEFGV
jgi:hypothetical protein